MTRYCKNDTNIVMKIRIEKIQTEMVRLKWDKKRLAREAGVSRQTIYNVWEHPDVYSNATLSGLARALDVDEKDLIT